MNSNSKSDGPNNNHCVHVIGIGRTGAAYVEAMLRTGEVEDMLAGEGGSFSALLIDIGEDDMFVPNDYARSMRHRLASRSIPESRFHYESVLLEIPDANEFAKQLEAARGPFKASTGQELLAMPIGFELPMVGSHTPRRIAKLIGAIGMYVGGKPIEAALTRFAKHVKSAGTPSTIVVAYGLAGGTGSGMAVDLTQALRAQLGSEVRIVGLGQMSHSGDGAYHNSLAQTLSLESIDALVKEDSKKNPFNGGFFVVLAEHSWQRLTAYTSTGQREVRQRFKQMVTNRFVADSFARWATSDECANLNRIASRSDGGWVLFDVAKLSHPGVQVLPGEAESRWDSVLQQWINLTPTFAGLSGSFKTKFAEIHLYAARHMKIELMEEEMVRVVKSAFMVAEDCSISTFRTEFFDALTAYGIIVLTGAKSESLVVYQEAQAALKGVGAAEKLMETA